MDTVQFEFNGEYRAVDIWFATKMHEALKVFVSVGVLKKHVDDDLTHNLQANVSNNNLTGEIGGVLLTKDELVIHCLEGPESLINALADQIEDTPFFTSLVILLEQRLLQRFYREGSVKIFHPDYETMERLVNGKWWQTTEQDEPINPFTHGGLLALRALCVKS